MIKTTIFIFAIVVVSNCTLGVVTDITDSNTATAFPCIVKGGYTDVTIGVSSSPTQIMVDTTGIQNLNKAKNAFTKVSLAFFSCRGRDPVKQVDEFVKKVSKDLYSQIWVYLGQESLWYQCSPSSFNAQQNCDYMHTLLNQFKKYNVTVGIASEESKWSDQCSNVCNDLGSYPLYWTPNADNIPSFSNFKPFGGWKTPAVKVYQWS